jgi:hypothetical protein
MQQELKCSAEANCLFCLFGSVLKSEMFMALKMFLCHEQDFAALPPQRDATNFHSLSLLVSLTAVMRHTIDPKCGCGMLQSTTQVYANVCVAPCRRRH